MADVTAHAYAADTNNGRNHFNAGRGGAGALAFNVAFGTDNLGLGDKASLYHFAQDTWIVDCTIDFDDLDTNGTPLVDFDIGTDVQPTLLANGDTSARTGATFTLSAPVFVPAGETFQLLVGAAAATAAAGNAKVIMTLANAPA